MSSNSLLLPRLREILKWGTWEPGDIQAAIDEIGRLRAALERFVRAAKSWHDAHNHVGSPVQCDWLCECIPQGEAALAGHAHEKSTPLSDFVRNATPEEKEAVYGRVMEKACEAQEALMEARFARRPLPTVDRYELTLREVLRELQLSDAFESLQAKIILALMPDSPAVETSECPHCREVYEIWAGSEGMRPETAPEAYQERLIHQMRDAAKRGLQSETFGEHGEERK